MISTARLKPKAPIESAHFPSLLALVLSARIDPLDHLASPSGRLPSSPPATARLLLRDGAAQAPSELARALCVGASSASLPATGRFVSVAALRMECGRASPDDATRRDSLAAANTTDLHGFRATFCLRPRRTLELEPFLSGSLFAVRAVLAVASFCAWAREHCARRQV
ncbi:hypothetical protein B0H17DRAFT_1217159 [Mycena rosella]|uniref:Uncharacterized protein n=1 Tax=Mycena rosella TaxID=1033263 RepID=A0AAD7FSN9_MYCRO|nr:hypothetical protein B0H17DRAFT_1217159 [Mycena rosella]